MVSLVAVEKAVCGRKLEEVSEFVGITPGELGDASKSVANRVWMKNESFGGLVDTEIGIDISPKRGSHLAELCGSVGESNFVLRCRPKR